MLRALLPVSLILLFVPAPSNAGVRLPVTARFDLSAIPSAPAEILAQLGKCQITLGRAVEVAAKAAGGVAGSAQLGGTMDAPVFEVLVFAGGAAHLVVVDGKSGEVKSQAEFPRLPGEATTGDWVELPSGLKYFELRAGSGAKPALPTTTVKVRYTGWLLDGTEFDSSSKRSEPYTNPLEKMIKGLAEGVGGMQVGGKRKLVVPSALAFGDQGRPGIPGKATLVFDVELLEIVP